jgi:hypothetical protein
VWAELLMVRVTDEDGVESEPLVVTVQGAQVTLECHGLRMEGFTDELREALAPRREQRAA